jgi:flagellar biosynthetic protein FliR
VDLWSLPYQNFTAFFMILIRVSVILFMFPFFNSRVIPVTSKIGLAFIITLVLFPVTAMPKEKFPLTVWAMAQIILGELIIGMILGLMVQLFFEGVRLMGQLVGFQTGFAITNIIDPQNGIQVSIFSNMAYLVAMVLFLLLNGHHILLRALRDSFEVIHMGSVRLDQQVMTELMARTSDMFVIALKIGAPAITALLFTKVAFGLVTKLMPQINIMIVAFPVQIVVGLLFFGITLSILLHCMEGYLSELGDLILHVMARMNG